jgi:beta-lactam-binding protein with PASTA domain/tRNA A-37 threonylcarbamoyl transferase component Bud32
MKLEPSQRVGDRYVLVSRLGSGGMADVWLAQDEMLGRRVALKFLHERFAQDAQFVERFRREARSAAGLQHPNVVGVYDRGDFDGRHWIAMEYVEGASLKDLIGRGLSVGEAVEIVRQVLVAAQFAHAHGIVHRDLKPQNVLVDSQGRARVTDFGIARAGVSEITQTGSVLGTAQYLSPEQAQGLEVTAASDVYSLGVMLYEALTGRVPFEAETPVAVALMQISEQPRPPSQLNAQISPALDAVVLRALAKEPTNRFASAEEFLRALDAAEADPAGAAVGQTAAYGPGAAGALAGAAGAALGAEAAEAQPVPPVPPEEAEQRRWLTRRRAIALAVLALIAIGVGAWALTRPEKATVPGGLVGKPIAEARAQLERQGLDVAVNAIENCAEPNTVTEQQPLGGTEVDGGSQVTLTVSAGMQVTVPPLERQRLSKARKRLEDANLLVATQSRSSRSVPAGRVIGSTPPAGDAVDCGATVTVLVSKGPNLVTLDDLTGLSQEVAEAHLERAGLIANVDTQDADEPEGQVIAQDPGPGSDLEKGEEVTIIVSTGVGAVTVPDVVGQSEDAARSRLSAAGLDVDVIVQETDEEGDDERVLQQAPGAGSRLRSGDTVTLVVGKFIEPETTTTSTTTTPTTTTGTVQ